MRGFIDDRRRIVPPNPAPEGSQSAFMRGFIDDGAASVAPEGAAGLNPRSCAASSMTADGSVLDVTEHVSQSAFMRGFIDDLESRNTQRLIVKSQSAFMRGFIDDARVTVDVTREGVSLNPRSCAASSMTPPTDPEDLPCPKSQSAFMRGFIDDTLRPRGPRLRGRVSIRVHARLHR